MWNEPSAGVVLAETDGEVRLPAPAVVDRVEADSIGDELGIQPGDRLLSVNGVRPRDLIDLQFLVGEEELCLEVQDPDGTVHQVELEKDADEGLGLAFTEALFDGWKRSEAARFSFLLGIPAISLAGLVELKDAFSAPATGGALPLLVGIISSAVVSWLAIAWLLRFLQNHSTWWFVGYRVFFGLGVILWAARSVA